LCQLWLLVVCCCRFCFFLFFVVDRTPHPSLSSPSLSEFSCLGTGTKCPLTL
jgi:hypothetical protein